MWPDKISHNTGSCSKFHFGDCVESQPSGIAKPTAGVIDKIRPTVTKFYGSKKPRTQNTNKFVAKQFGAGKKRKTFKRAT